MPKMQECIKLNKIKPNIKFKSTNYTTAMTSQLHSLCRHHELRLFTKETTPIANFNYCEASIIDALSDQSYAISAPNITHIMTCNPFNKRTQKKYHQLYAYVTTLENFIDHLANQYPNDPTKGLFNMLHFYGSYQNSTDIHISESIGISFKQNGIHQMTLPLNKHSQLKLLYFIKLYSHLDPAITKSPQDGAYQFTSNDTTFDVRVATLPTQCGELMSLRLFNKNKEFKTLHALGFSHEKVIAIQQMINAPHGLILITGSTGSGKSTTLYTLLNDMRHRHVITLEDPIEKVIPDIHQTSINDHQGYAMDIGLKAILRHNPNVIAIGEIRDHQTAETVINAAYSGHLVIASLHTNSIETTLLRLAHLGISPFMIGYCLRGIISQSLTTVNKNITLKSQLLICKKPYIINNIKKELTAYIKHNTLIK